jgi:hypothetical protein
MLASLMVIQGSNEAAAANLEDLVWRVCQAVRALGCQVGSVTVPRQQQYGATQVLMLDIPITAHVDD